MNLMFPMILMVPAVFIYLFFIPIILIWFLVVSIMDKNKEWIIKLSIIILIYGAFLGGLLYLYYYLV